MSRSDEDLAEVGRLIASELHARPTEKTRVVFRITLRGYDYDTTIAALAYGLRVGLFREQGRLLVPCAEARESQNP